MKLQNLIPDLKKYDILRAMAKKDRKALFHAIKAGRNKSRLEPNKDELGIRGASPVKMLEPGTGHVDNGSYGGVDTG